MADANVDGLVSDARSGGIVDDAEPNAAGSGTASVDGADPSDGIPLKRGRGRPRKDGGAGSSGNPAGDGGRKEGPRASGPKALDVDLFAQQLMGMHLIAAKLLRAPELIIGPDEAKNLAKAVQNLMKHYSINVSPKTVALMQLAGVAAAVYAPRAIMIANRKGKEAQHKKQAQNPMSGFTPSPDPVPGAFDQPPPPQGTMTYQ